MSRKRDHKIYLQGSGFVTTGSSDLKQKIRRSRIPMEDGNGG